MTLPDPLDYWQDIDDPDWSDEREAAFITALSLHSANHAFRPPDDLDEDVHPESLRGKVLALYAEMERVMAVVVEETR